MTPPLSLQLALRFSRARRRAGIVSLISLLSTCGIALGVAVLIIGLSAMNGFERELNNRILAVVPHGEISPVNPPWLDWPAALRHIKQVPGVAGAAPYIQFTGLVGNGNKLRAIQIKAVDPQAEQQLSALPRYVLNQAWQHFQAGQQQIILGSGVARTLQVTTGDWISVMIPHRDQQTATPASTHKLLQPKRLRLQVSGILQLNGQLDHQLALLPLTDVQHYLDMRTEISGIAIKAQDPFTADQLVRTAAEATGDYVYIKSWMNSYGYMYRDIKMIRAIMYLAMVLVVGVACFNIVSTLVMAVKDKSTDIAILRTLGSDNRLIRRIFICYGLLSGLTGSILGTLTGALLAWKLTPIINWLETLTGHNLLSGDIYFIDFLPSELHVTDIFFVLFTALALSLLASWYPARRASHLDPARILSGQ